MRKACITSGALVLVATGLLVAHMVSTQSAPAGLLRTAVVDGDVAKLKSLLTRHPGLANYDYGGGTRPLHYAASADRGATAATELLISKGADPNVRNAAGQTPMMFAAKDDRTAVVTTLLRHRADPNIISKAGVSALDMASWQGNVGPARALLTGGASVSTPDRTASRYTPLHWAARFGRKDVALLLLNAGADAHAQSGDGTPAQVARRSGEDGVAQAILNYRKGSCP